ncbi:CtsR family transcriptional regulator [Hazenella sp. IB182357]|uniref:Transcriptional regulator CtsR n=1 Tax=Polycladospora coralii TaxID=2771432 RepID=A0A926NAD2_9BACL|nr:CtsR family transcriptional regulator [Polycladospora coralii]MBD1372402.1 CtsR family transcriptional regulator [Polycladospora coralii]MBS7531408.1 CtsR family transcriptional regulator [Polycladospora coralii]
MGNVSDIIAQYITGILEDSPTGTVEIKRSELACAFQCVPSQINYVISTRFTIEKGYLVESKRGGGGYIRIQKIHLKSRQSDFEYLLNHIGNAIPQLTAEHLISRLVDEDWITEREALMMKRLIARETLQVPIPIRDQLRARMMRILIITIFTDKGE